MFKEHFVKWLEDKDFSHVERGFLKEDEFDRSLNRVIDRVLNEVADAPDRERALQNIKSRGDYADIRNSNAQLKRFADQIFDKRSQELKADMIERRRYLFYRIATALGIAAVILLTGALAKCLSIPLPLIRLAS